MTLAASLSRVARQDLVDVAPAPAPGDEAAGTTTDGVAHRWSPREIGDWIVSPRGDTMKTLANPQGALTMATFDELVSLDLDGGAQERAS